MDEAARLLLTEIGGRRLRDIERTVQVHVDHGAPVFVAHLVPDCVAQDAGIVDHRVDPAKLLDRIFDDRLRTGRIVHESEVGIGLAASGNDIVHGLLGWPRIAAFPAAANARIVHDHSRAMLGAKQRDFTAYAAACTGNCNNLAFKHTRHRISPYA